MRMCRCFILGITAGMTAGIAVGMLAVPKKKRVNDLMKLANDIMDVFR